MSRNPFQSGGAARCVFVGNIPYDATEQQLIEIFQEVGPVVSFRLVFDRENGKPKGYGFCEYRDAETALSAIRNLNDYEFNNRLLRVDYAENEKANMQAAAAALGIVPPVGGGHSRIMPQGNNPQSSSSSSTLPPFPNFSGTPSTPESVNTMLENMSQSQLLEMLMKMKNLVSQNRAQAKSLLLNHPPLAYALLQAQTILGFISVETAQTVMQQSLPPLSRNGNTGSSMGSYPSTTGGFLPQQYQPVAPQQMPILEPIPMGTQPQPAPQAAPITDAQASLLQQVVHLTPEQISALPPEQQEQVNQLRQHLLSFQFS